MFNKLRKFVENNKYFIPLMGVLSVLLVLFSIGAFITNKKMNVLSVRYDASLNEFNKANDKLFGMNMAAFEKILLGSFNNEQLVRISKKNTNYGISINGKPLRKDQNMVDSERPTVAILLSENYGKEALNSLPRSVVEKGSIITLENAPNLIEVIHGDAKLENNIYDFYYGKTLSYLVTGLKVGDIITLEIEEKIARKMGLQDNIIEIFYSKEFAEMS